MPVPTPQAIPNSFEELDVVTSTGEDEDEVEETVVKKPTGARKIGKAK